MRNHLKIIIAQLFLALVIMCVYWQTQSFDYINFDDRDYVTNNKIVQQGLTLDGFIWAFTAYHASNWHPLTWLSHMLDCELYGLDPGKHHWTNVQFHILNTMLLFHIFYQITGAFYRCILLSLLFALHPMHVESVAWISERKDVLSTFFAFISLECYRRYVSNPTLIRYYIVFLFMGLGLLAKPMIVTLPFVMLLLDFWPLNRMGSPHFKGRPPYSFDGRQFLQVLKEKNPFLVLITLICIITLTAQIKGGAVGGIAEFSIIHRLANAFSAYILYIFKTIWCFNLAIYYPLDIVWNPAVDGSKLVSLGILSFILVIIMLYWTLKRYVKYPYLIFGIFWFLGTLFPVIGIIFKAGSQSMADRYTYIPHIGLFTVLIWGSADIMKKWRLAPSHFLRLMLILILTSFLGITTYIQVGYWRNSITLYRHALKVEPHNPLIHSNLSVALLNKNKIEAAIYHAQKAIEQHPEYLPPRFNLGNIYKQIGQYKKAIIQYRKIVHLNPMSIQAYQQMATIYLGSGDTYQALIVLDKILNIAPNHLYSLFHTVKLLNNPASRGDIGPERAIVLAKKLCALTRYKDFLALDLLASSYANAKIYHKAIQIERLATQLIPVGIEPAIAYKINYKLSLYEKGIPYFEMN